MSDKYSSIEYCVNLLYNAFYGDKKNCIAINPINRKEINIEDLRKPLDFDYKEIFEGKFKLLGYYNNRYHYKRISSNNFGTTILIGVNELNSNDMKRPEI